MRFVAIGLIVVGFGLLLNLWKNESIYAPKKDPWPTVEGTVLESRLVVIGENEETGESTFRPLIKYQFEYQGKVFTEKRIFPKETQFESRRDAKRVTERFQPESKIDVFINPNFATKPRSVLIWEFPDMLHPLTLIALLCETIGIATFIYIFVGFLLDRRKVS